MNINDPAGVKALLDQLRASQAWQEAMGPQPTASSTSQATSGDSSSQPPSSEPSVSVASSSIGDSDTGSQNTNIPSSVASLLSQLHAVQEPARTQNPRRVQQTPSTSANNVGFSFQPEFEPSHHGNVITPASTQETHAQDPRSMTFQQALPHLAKLAENPRFVSTLTRLKKEQDDLERQLWEDRREIYRKYEERVKVAVTKASMMGDLGLSKHEADTLQTGLTTALEKFDRERTLHAWDGLVSKQQTTLAQFNVPTMFQTVESADRERQQRVIQVLGGILQS